MIKYLELTAPEKSEFRQAKILSIEVSEGDRVEIGDTLFRVKSGPNNIDLPATRAGVVTEIIVLVDENISVMTPLLLLETEVKESTATPPLNDYAGNPLTTPFPETPQIQDTAHEKQRRADSRESQGDKERSPHKQASVIKKKKNSKKIRKKHQQQDLDLSNGQEHNDGSIQCRSSAPSDNATVEDKRTIELEPHSDHQPELTDSAPIVDTSSNNDQLITINIPDIGTDSAKVVDIFVKVGDQIGIEQSLITLESDKASMDVPSTHAGVVTSVKLELEQDASEGDAIIELTVSTESDLASSGDPAPAESEPKLEQASEQAKSEPSLLEVTIPDIGGDSAQVVEILVSVGQTVALDDSLITLESDKASMDVPSSATGEIQSINVELDQEVSEGVVVITVLGHSKPEPQSQIETSNEAGTEKTANKRKPSSSPAPAPKKTQATEPKMAPDTGKSHASPSIRRFARELGVPLSRVSGTGRKNRISKDDVKKYVKGVMTNGPVTSHANNSSAGIPPVPAVDFSKFGEIDIQPLNRIKRLTATNLHRSWLNVPHVTHADESNISGLEEFRKQLNEEYKTQGSAIKLSPLAFIVKAVAHALKTYPQFNSSLEPGGENLIYKKYINIGIAVETPNGLVVPVLKDADKKSVKEIAESMGELAVKARDNKLTMSDMSGSCFTISSLGGIGGTHFTPIVNAPEVAILGVSRTKMQPLWDGKEFIPALMLPLSLSYDHRVIDGAEAARFTRHIAAVLEDVRRLTV